MKFIAQNPSVQLSSLGLLPMETATIPLESAAVVGAVKGEYEKYHVTSDQDSAILVALKMESLQIACRLPHDSFASRHETHGSMTKTLVIIIKKSEMPQVTRAALEALHSDVVDLTQQVKSLLQTAIADAKGRCSEKTSEALKSAIDEGGKETEIAITRDINEELGKKIIDATMKEKGLKKNQTAIEVSMLETTEMVAQNEGEAYAAKADSLALQYLGEKISARPNLRVQGILNAVTRALGLPDAT